jgi:hypothetical protein
MHARWAIFFDPSASLNAILFPWIVSGDLGARHQAGELIFVGFCFLQMEPLCAHSFFFLKKTPIVRFHMFESTEYGTRVIRTLHPFIAKCFADS